jgi:hypothetical protein
VRSEDAADALERAAECDVCAWSAQYRTHTSTTSLNFCSIFEERVYFEKRGGLPQQFLGGPKLIVIPDSIEFSTLKRQQQQQQCRPASGNEALASYWRNMDYNFKCSPKALQRPLRSAT